MSKHFYLWIGIPLFNCLAQIFVKLAAASLAQLTGSGLAWVISAALSPWMLAAIVVEIACFFLWIEVLAEFELSRAFPISALSYILVIAASALLFKESLSLLQLFGSALILTGVWAITTASAPPADET